MMTMTTQAPTIAGDRRLPRTSDCGDHRFRPPRISRRTRNDVLQMLAGADGARLPLLPRRRRPVR